MTEVEDETMDDVRIHTPLSQPTMELLAQTIGQVVQGSALPSRVTSVLQRVCEESRGRPPELLLLRIKELWAKISSGSRVSFEERDRRYFSFIGECLVLYFELPPAPPVRHYPLREGALRVRDASGCGEPEGIPLT
jgi:hypothetical protein